MVKVYAVVLVVGIVLLIGWIFAHAFSANSSVDRFDPEERFGIPGRRIVAALVGFGMAGMSAEFSPRDLGWPVALGLAIVGASALAWYAGRIDSERPEDDDAETMQIG